MWLWLGVVSLWFSFSVVCRKGKENLVIVCVVCFQDTALYIVRIIFDTFTAEKYIPLIRNPIGTAC